MENENTQNPFAKMSDEQLKAAKREIAKRLAMTVAIKVGVSVAVSLTARALVRAIEKKELESKATD